MPSSMLEAPRQAARVRHQPRLMSWRGVSMVLTLWGLARGTMVWWLTHKVGLYDNFARLTVQIRGHDSRT
jgi:hypothetical protein